MKFELEEVKKEDCFEEKREVRTNQWEGGQERGLTPARRDEETAPFLLLVFLTFSCEMREAWRRESVLLPSRDNARKRNTPLCIR
jgi:hypothetical protein